MAKLSEQLAGLSAHAKHAEDAVSAAQKEAHDKVMARRIIIARCLGSSIHSAKEESEVRC